MMKLKLVLLASMYTNTNTCLPIYSLFYNELAQALFKKIQNIVYLYRFPFSAHFRPVNITT